jgi:hypothetical protein
MISLLLDVRLNELKSERIGIIWKVENPRFCLRSLKE